MKNGDDPAIVLGGFTAHQGDDPGAIKEDPRHCFYKRRMKEVKPEAKDFIFGYHTIRWSEDGYRYHISTPPPVKNAMKRFDKGEDPVTFPKLKIDYDQADCYLPGGVHVDDPQAEEKVERERSRKRLHHERVKNGHQPTHRTEKELEYDRKKIRKG